MKVFMKLISILGGGLLLPVVFAEQAWAWGPAIHAAISCTVLQKAVSIFPAVANVIQSFPLEYIYGSLAADFMIGKGQKQKPGHPHNWETGFRFLGEAIDDQEAAYAYGFLSHLAADVVAHNYFVPDLVYRASKLKRMGHIYWEARADHFVGPDYMRIAKDVLSREELDCDDMLRLAVGKRGRGIKARRQLFTQSVKLTDFLSCSPSLLLASKSSRYQISPDYLTFMLDLSYRLVKDFLKHPYTSRCLSYDPIGTQNLRLARRNGFISKVLHQPHPISRFDVAPELLEL
jgi:hypothetical protein